MIYVAFLSFRHRGSASGVIWSGLPFFCARTILEPLQWRHNCCDGVSNHKRLDCLVDLLFRPRSKKTSKLHATGLCEGSSPMTSEFPAQRAINAENVSIWWRHHAKRSKTVRIPYGIYSRYLHWSIWYSYRFQIARAVFYWKSEHSLIWSVALQCLTYILTMIHIVFAYNTQTHGVSVLICKR